MREAKNWSILSDSPWETECPVPPYPLGESILEGEWGGGGKGVGGGLRTEGMKWEDVGGEGKDGREEGWAGEEEEEEEGGR